MKKKLLSAVLAAALCVASCGAALAEGDYAMQIPLTGVMCVAPTSVAYLLKYFDDEGLKYNAYRSESSVNYSAMIAGKNDSVFGLLPTIVQRMAGGFELDVVMGVHFGCINMVASKASGITSIEQLKGRKIGVPGMGTDPHIMLQRVLKAHNIGSTPENMEVTIMAFQDSSLQIPLEKGDIDAMIAWDPFATKVADTTDSVMIYQQAEYPTTKDEYCCLIGLRKEFLRDHPESAAKYCRAMSRACDYIAQNPREAAKLIIDNNLCPIDDVELTAKLLASYRYKADIKGGKESFLACTRDLAELGIIELRETPEEFTEKAFAEVPGFEVK